ncbi:MAG: HNH endonuclease [Lysobacter sp.]|nr:HNH endonuclease [Lysobacter sp.]
MKPWKAKTLDSRLRGNDDQERHARGASAREGQKRKAKDSAGLVAYFDDASSGTAYRRRRAADGTGALMISDQISLDDALPSSGNWSREQTKLAFHFYCQTPFGKLHSRNKKVIELATLIRRTPSSVAMKLGNLASLDPAIRASGRAGLGNASGMDKEVWSEFHGNWETLALECAQFRRQLSETTPELPDNEAPDIELEDFTGETRQVLTEQRIKQAFFRKAVLSSYRTRCCISGVSDSRLLVASHIVVWRADKSNRLNPSNGLCLSAIHDKAFDAHLITLSEDLRVVVSERLLGLKDELSTLSFTKAEGRRIELPERFHPHPDFLARHRQRFFEVCST